MDVQTAIDEFLLSLRAEGVAQTTIKWYSSILRTFTREFGNVDMSAITSKQIREYLSVIRDRAPHNGSKAPKISGQTLYGYHRVLNTFFGWNQREFDSPNPMKNIKRPRRPIPNPKSVEHEDVIKMFDVATDIRDRVILAFLTDTGCRVSEMCNLKIQDINLTAMNVVTVGKGAKPRLLMFSSFTRDLIKIYLENRSEVGEWFMMGRLGQLTRWGVGRALKRIAKKAGVTGRINPHAFRHGFAIFYLMNGGDLATLSKILGHSSAAFTADVYGIFDNEKLRNLHFKHSPIQVIESKNSLK